MECIRLRIQDIDFGQGHIYIRHGKGDKDRTTFLPHDIHPELRDHIERVTQLHFQDLEEGYGNIHACNAKRPQHNAKPIGFFNKIITIGMKPNCPIHLLPPRQDRVKLVF